MTGGHDSQPSSYEVFRSIVNLSLLDFSCAIPVLMMPLLSSRLLFSRALLIVCYGTNFVRAAGEGISYDFPEHRSTCCVLGSRIS